MNSKKALRFSARTRFLPWVGRKYWTGGPGGRRLLVIGESHYSGKPSAVKWDRQNRWLTRDVIKRQWLEENYSYHRKVAHVIAGQPVQGSEIRPFWESVAFYSFVQDIVGVGPRVRPTKKQWQEALEVLPGVIDQLEPDCVLATGWQLWIHLPSWEPSAPLHLQRRQIETCVDWARSGRAFRATYIDHPASWGFGNGSRWAPLAMEFLSLALPARAAARKEIRA